MDSMAAHKLKSRDCDLHRPYIDDTIFSCGKCGGKMKRVPEVIDCWFDSGAMPFAQLHYPFENKELFDDSLTRPIISAKPSTRRAAGSTACTPYPRFYSTVPVIKMYLPGAHPGCQRREDEQEQGQCRRTAGRDQKDGADALRWYCYTSAPPGNVRRFDTKMVAEITRSVHADPVERLFLLRDVCQYR